MNVKKIKDKMTLNPIMTFVILIIITIVLSGFLSLLGVQSSYSKLGAAKELVTQVESVESLFSLSGLKYIFSNTVSNFAAFAPLINLIIVLFGIGIMEKSGFLKTAFKLLTKHAKKYSVTFVLVLVSIVASIAGDLAYVILIPLSALLFIHGKRNPLLGIITTFAALCCGSGISMLFTSMDSTLLQTTLSSAHNLDATYTVGIYATFFIMLAATIILAFIITKISEDVISPKLNKYEFEETEEEEITNRNLKGLIFGIGAALVYILIFIYLILDINLPLAGSLLDQSQNLYIDKLFSFDSFFSNGFVFIITMLFIILGFFYGIGAKTIKNNNDVSKFLGHSLDGIGKPIVLIFFAATFISIFKRTNIGPVIVGFFANIIGNTSFTGIPLIILIFVLVAIATIFVPSSLAKWTILSGVTVPVMMNAGLSPEFTQTIFRFAESFTLGLTPLFAYAVIYLAYLEKYNQKEKPISLFTTFKYQLPYSLITGGILLVLLIIWFIIGLPIGFGGSAVL